MHYFRYDNIKTVSPGSGITLDQQEENHLFRILRARPGDRIGLLDGRGCRAIAEVGSARSLRLLSAETLPVPPVRIHLYIAPPRRQKMDLLLKQAVELGVWRIVPLIAERSVALPKEDVAAGRWNDLLFEACKQSANPFLPEVSAPLHFAAGLENASQHCAVSFYGSPRRSGFRSLTPETCDIGFFVGPEGGFSPAEEEKMEQTGLLPLRIGNWTLRVETAAMAGIAVLTAFAAEQTGNGISPTA